MSNTDGAGVSRRTLFGVTAGAAAAVLAAGAAPAAATPGRRSADPNATPLTADQAWQKLVAGNDRFVAGRQPTRTSPSSGVSPSCRDNTRSR